MKRILIAAGIACLPYTAGAAEWQTVSRSCAEEVAASLGGCGSCSGAWPQISRCVVEHVAPSAPAWIVDACISTVGSRTVNQPGAFDRVGPVLACATREAVKP